MTVSLSPDVREDALPEGANYYADTGCDLNPACLTCPLPKCRYDEHRAAARARTRKEQVIILHAAGHKPQDIADFVGISKRSVFRMLEHAR